MNGVADTPLFELRELRKHYPIERGILFRRRTGVVRAVDGVDLVIRRAETLGLVGESGCGKSTVGRCILGLEAPTSGRVLFAGRDLAGFDRAAERRFRRRVQAVFQDPFSSLNPRMTVEEIVGEPLLVHGLARERRARLRRVRELLELCGLPRQLVDRYPHEMSGGQRQRVGIARALALEPEFVLCDEAVSALDVSIQAQIIRLLEDLRERLGLTYLFIAHDLSVVRHISHRVAVMYLGRIVEIADSELLFADPRHPYTQALLSAVPVPDPEIERRRPHRPVGGEIPNPAAPPAGCVFHPRCPFAEARCRREPPVLRPIGDRHEAACHRLEETAMAGPGSGDRAADAGRAEDLATPTSTGRAT